MTKVYEIYTFDYFSLTHESFGELFGTGAVIPPQLPHRNIFFITRNMNDSLAWQLFSRNDTIDENDEQDVNGKLFAQSVCM